MSKAVLRIFLMIVLIFIALCAVIGIFTVLGRNFNSSFIETMTSLVVLSLTGLCCFSLLDERQRGTRTFAVFGVGVSLSGCMFAVLTSSGLLGLNSGLDLKEYFSLRAIALSLTHLSLLLSIKTEYLVVNIVRFCTITASTAVTLYFLVMVYRLSPWAPVLPHLEIFLVCMILGIAGTIATPILQVVLKSSSTSSTVR